MKRAFIFLVVAPVSVFCTVLLMCVDAGMKSLDFVCVVGVVLAILSLPMAAISAAIDGYLARAVPVSLRASVIAGVGATIAAGETLAVFSSLLSPSIIMALAVGAALVAAACTLLSHDYGDRPRCGLEPAGA